MSVVTETDPPVNAPTAAPPATAATNERLHSCVITVESSTGFGAWVYERPGATRPTSSPRIVARIATATPSDVSQSDKPSGSRDEFGAAHPAERASWSTISDAVTVTTEHTVTQATRRVLRLACLNNRVHRSEIECLVPRWQAHGTSLDGVSCLIDLVCAGGTLVLDDVTPEQHWPDTWRGRADRKRGSARHDDRPLSAEFRVTSP